MINQRHANLPAESKHNQTRRAQTLGVMTLASQITVTQDDPDTFRLRVSVARPKRPPLWTGFIVSSIRGSSERREAYLSMANEIMRFWGRTHQE
jgi:hypothetical protein